MLVAQILAGYSLGGADLLRRAMGKKKAEEMAEQREIFLTGAKKRGVDDKVAGRLFDLMEKFAEYGFNKSHSAAYALIAYHTAWLKAHYPAEFMAATMSSEMTDTDKVRIFYEDAKANGIEMLPPDLNQSGYRFEPVGDKQIRYGLGAIKGTGEAAIGAIVAARVGGGAFTGLFDLCRRVDKRYLNRRVLEALIKGGAFDGIHPNRASLMASIASAMEVADRAARGGGQGGLFGEEVSLDVGEPCVETPPWPDKEKLLQEKSALGFYLSGHPFNACAEELAKFVRQRLNELQPSREPQLMAGVIVSVRTQMTRRGKMAVVLLDDATTPMEVVVFSETFDAYRDWIKEDELLIVEGKVSDDAYSGGLRVTADKVYDLAHARNRFARQLRLTCNGQSGTAKLREILAPYRIEEGGCPVAIAYHNGKAACEVSLGGAWQVQLHDRLIETLGQWLEPACVQVRY